MKCENCGKEIRESFKFCPKCGTKIMKEETIPQKETVLEEKQMGTSLSQKILLGIGVLAILINIFLLFISDYNPEKDFRFLPAILVTIGLLAPVSFWYRHENTDDEYMYSIMAAIAGLVLSIVAGLFLKEKSNDGFFADFYDALSSSGFSILYLVMLIISLVISWRARNYGIIAVAFLIGILLPMIIAAILYVLFIIVGLVLLLAFAFGGKGRSLNTSFSGSDGSFVKDEAHSDVTHYYEIEWEDEKGYRKTSSTYYPKPVSYDQVANDFKSKFWGNGINIRIISVKKRH
jgi:hypothetical protein